MEDLNILAAAVIVGLGAVGVVMGLVVLGSKYMKVVARRLDLIQLLRTHFFIVMGLLDVVPMSGVVFGMYRFLAK